MTEAAGAAGPILNDWLKSRDAYDRAGMKLLKEMLGKRPKWRTLTLPSRLSGADEKDTKDLVLVAGAGAF